MFFKPGKQVYSSSSPHFVSSAAALDINGDGYLDLVVGRDYANPDRNKGIELEILLGGKGGTFKNGSKAVIGTIPDPIGPHRELVADFNGDGRLDVFLVNSGMDAAPFPGSKGTLLLSSGNKLVDATGNLPSIDAFAHGAGKGDIDRDGDIDIFVANVNGQSNIGPYFLINDGTGHFTAAFDRLPSFYADLNQSVWPAAHLADFNNDGATDLWLGTNNWNIDNAVLGNDGSGQFTLASGVTPHQTREMYAMYILSADLNGDGLLDVIQGEGESSATRGTREVSIFINQGNLQFADETASRLFGLTLEGKLLYQHMSRIHLGDFNGDKALDLVVEPNGDKVQIFINNGDGVFFKPSNGTVPTEGGRVLVGDFTRDGRADIIAYGGHPDIDPYLFVLDDGPAMKFTGTGKADKLFGDARGNTLDGKGGNDYLRPGAGKDKARGDSGNDTIDGGSGKDLIAGGSGKDRLVGGGQADSFVFDVRPAAKHADTIVDFAPGLDRIRLDGDLFKRIGPSLEAGEFYAAAGATAGQDGDDRIVYDTTTGKLYYDADGAKAGGAKAIHFATLSNLALLDAGDFVIV